jgi:hypothetical protein
MKLVSLLLGCLLSIASAHAQIVTLPIPGSPLSLNVMANPQPLQNIYNNPAATQYQLWDDGYANVSLPFTFPFFDKTFNNSTMYSNGAVQFGPPVTGFPSNNTFCCSGITIDRNTPSAYNYSILMMQDDLYGSTGANHYSLGTSNTMTYGWYNVERLGRPENKTSFELKIDNTGGIDMRWTGALLSWSSPAIGVIGDASKGEFAVLQQGGLSTNTFSITGLTQWTTGQTPDIVIDPCTSNPLYSQTCSGYEAAYTQQQCSTNPLYSTTCSGYQAAYTQQQCSINPLYSTTCSGYQAAYNEQQCSVNQLYSTTCSGYAAAYLQQQCTANPLYSTTCEGYATAYKTQQCSLNALYATDCPGYEQAYLNSQCIIDSLYSRLCEGYATAYAIKNLVKFSDSTVSSSVNQSLSDTAATKANDPANTIVATNTASTTISSDGTVSTGVSTTGDTNVDKAIAPKTTSASASPSAPVQLSAPAPALAPVAQKQEDKKSEGKSEGKAEGKSDGGGQQQAQNNKQGGDSKPAAPTARQELQAKREAAAKAEAVEKGKNLANEMGKAADMEAQKQIQNVVIQAMGFTPGFDSYGKVMMNDTVGYKPFSIYNNQKNIDNRANLRMFGGTDILHSQMVESQYKKED